MNTWQTATNSHVYITLE